MHSLKTYIYNKFFSFLGVFACIFVSFIYFGFSTIQWQVILLSIIIAGYSHFFLGFYYQLKSFHRQEKPWQSYLLFFLLCVFSVVFAYGILELFGFMAALFFGFLYFLLHGLFNEQTLILRQGGVKVPLIILTPLAIFVMALLTYSVPDKTFFFDAYLQFKNINDFMVSYTFENYYMGLAGFSNIFWVGLAVSLTLLLFAWLKKGFGVLCFSFGVFMLLVSGIVYFLGPPPYIYMYLFVVGYHFMTWQLFYLVEMKKRGAKQYKKFLLETFAVLVPLLFAAYLFMQPRTPDWVYLVFNYEFFIVTTYIHISVSFMNDGWFKNLQSKIFSRSKLVV